MPTTEPMTTGEIARTLVSIESKISQIQSDLNHKPDKDYVAEMKADQNRKHTEQDNAISAVEKRADQLLFAIIGTALAAAANLITNISGG